MSKIIIYNEGRQELSTISFIKDIPNQVKIRDVNIDESFNLAKQIGIILARASNLLGIKEPISDITKQDIMDAIFSRFKGLSPDEIAYAFKMDRYGNLGDRTQAYGLFNAQYVTDVLSKWEEYKRTKRKEYDISISKYKEVKVSEEEKEYWINLGVTTCLNNFIANGIIDDGRKKYVYDILYDKGYLPKDNKVKEKIKLDAITMLQIECSSPSNREEKTTYKETLKRIKNPKDSLLILKCYELTLITFFRELLKDDIKLQEFKKTFEPKKN